MTNFFKMQKNGPLSWYYKHNMDAVTYLISRKSKSAYRLSGIFLIASIIIWAKINLLDWAALHFSQTLNSGVPSFAYSILSFFAYLALFIAVGGVLIALPCQQFLALSGTLRTWVENRILEEFTATGLSHRYLLNHLLKYYLKRWLILSIPTVLFASLVLTPSDPDVPSFVLIYYGMTAAIFLAGTCSACWTIVSGRHSSAFMMIPYLVLGGPVAVLLAGFGLNSWVALISTIYIGLLSYVLSIRALESQSSFEEITLKVQSTLEPPKRSYKVSSENPIVARQEMRGLEIDDLLTSLAFISILLFTLYQAHRTGVFESVFVVIVVAGLAAAWRAAGKLSQSLTAEMESSTLETIRTTPMGSEIFLQGWLQVTLRPLFAEMTILAALTLPFLILRKPEALYDGSFLFIVIIALSAPFLGALFGASIAGQCRPRNEVSGQISTTVILCGVLGIPQIFLTLHSQETTWFPVLFTLFLIYGACWVLKAGARKSLNRVFLPQK